MWKCNNCNEELEDHFEVCWNCSHNKSGFFVKEKSEKEFKIWDSTETEKKPKTKAHNKAANEYGIAGFVLSSILILHEGFLNMLEMNVVLEKDEKMISFSIIMILYLPSIISSIMGCLRNGQLYQKGLAYTGFVLNVIIFIVILMAQI